MIGNGSFQTELRGAPAGSRAWLVLSSSRLDLAIGGLPCAIVPDPFGGFVWDAGSTGATGQAAVQFAIPGESTLVGVGFYRQWVLASGLSNAIHVEIQ